MKEYNRQTKKYEEKKTENVGDLSKRELCRKKEPHNYILVLPEYLQRRNQDATEEAINAYYESEERVKAFIESELQWKRTFKLDVGRGMHIFSKVYKYFECSVCGKKKME
mgnify:CR=1 FL=1